MNRVSLCRHKGLTLVEVAVAVAIAGTAAVWGLWVLGENMESERAKIQGDHLKELGDAMRAYSVDNYREIAENLPLAGFANPARPTIAELKSAGFLDNSFVATPFYGGSYVLRVTRSAGCALGLTQPGCSVTALSMLSQPMTYKGAVAWSSIGDAALRIGGRAGFSSASTPTVLSGLEGGWTATNPTATAGVLAIRDVYSSSENNTFLRRDGAYAMTGNLKMGGNAVLTEGGALNTAGGSITTGTGSISGGAITGSSLSTAGTITGGSLNVTSLAQTGSLQTGALAAASASVSGGLATGSMRITTNVAPGSACSAGSLGLSAAGDLLSCQGGTFQLQRRDTATQVGSLTATVNSHTTTLNSHTSTLNSHTSTLNSHTSTLNSHATLLSSHSSSISQSGSKDLLQDTKIRDLETRLASMGGGAPRLTATYRTEETVCYGWRSVASGYHDMCIITKTGAGQHGERYITPGGVRSDGKRIWMLSANVCYHAEMTCFDF